MNKFTHLYTLFETRLRDQGLSRVKNSEKVLITLSVNIASSVHCIMGVSMRSIF